MTNTIEVELVLCGDCAMIIANDDDSGSAEPEVVRAALAERWSGHRLVVLWISDEVNGIGSFEGDECDGCGRITTIVGEGVAVRV